MQFLCVGVVWCTSVFLCSFCLVGEQLMLMLVPPRCRQHSHVHHQFIGGDDINQTVHTVFAALLWHTPVLQEDIDRYGKFFDVVY